MFSKRNICRKIRENAETFYGRKNLHYMCGICATAISVGFTKNRHNNLFCYGNFISIRLENQPLSHCWTISGDKIYDITADQFNYLGYNYNRIHTGIVTRRFKPDVTIENPTKLSIIEFYKDSGFHTDLNHLEHLLKGI